MRFKYPTEKFSAARRLLMVPHPNGEADSVYAALRECSLALEDIDESELEDSAREWLSRIRPYIEASEHGELDSTDKNVQADLTRVIDELAHWFDRQFWTKK